MKEKDEKPLKDISLRKREELFTRYYNDIESALSKRRHKWKLSSLAYISYEDICQIITLHIYKKIHMYDEHQPFINWCNRIISHQLQNLVRNHYGNLAPPCNKCPHNEGDSRCGFTKSGLKGEACPVYKHWMKSKQAGYHLKLAGSLDHPDYIETKVNTKEDFDFDFQHKKLMGFLKEELDNTSWVILTDFIILKRNEKEVALQLEISVNELKRRKLMIVKLAKKELTGS